MTSQEINVNVTILEAIITNIKHYLYPELSKNDNVDKDIRVIITDKITDGKYIELSFKYILDTPRDNEKYKLLENLYFTAYEYISKYSAEYIFDNLIIFDEKRLTFYIHKSIIEGTSIPIPHFDYLHSFDIMKFNLPSKKTECITEDIETENIFIDEINKKLNEEFDKNVKHDIKISIDSLIESQNEFNYDAINILKENNINNGIVSDEIISYISNIDKYILVDLTNFVQLKKLASITKNINITELIKENVTSIIYNINDDKIMFKYINYKLNIKNILEIY